MQTLILCGGKGTRAYPHTIDVPKPLLEVRERPILLHVMEIYASQGFDTFILSAGYRADLIKEFAKNTSSTWNVEVVDTGEDTGTAGRIYGCRDLLQETFMATYADGLGDVNLDGLLSWHLGHRGAMTITAVPLPSPYGTLSINNEGQVTAFKEKPRLFDHWINAGYFVMEKRVFDTWNGTDLEGQVMPELSARGELFAYTHEGFWRSMDTYKDALSLSELVQDGRGPWMI